MSVGQEPAPADGEHHAPVPVSRVGDAEAGLKEIKPSPNRAFLPDSGRTSMHSHRTGTADGDPEGADDDNNSEFPWGPKHPCFPHPNPHVPLNSSLYNNTRIIRISRDWMQKGDLAPTFQNLYPEVLDPLIEEDTFRTLIQHINESLIDAFNPFSFRSCLDAVMGVATFWLWDDIGLTKVKRKLAELERWIEKWNRDCGEKEGVKIIPLRRTGYMTLDIQVPDPHFEVVPVSEPGSRRGQPEEAGVAASQHDGAHTPKPLTPTFQFNAGSPVDAETRS